MRGHLSHTCPSPQYEGRGGGRGDRGGQGGDRGGGGRGRDRVGPRANVAMIEEITSVTVDDRAVDLTKIKQRKMTRDFLGENVTALY